MDYYGSFFKKALKTTRNGNEKNVQNLFGPKKGGPFGPPYNVLTDAFFSGYHSGLFHLNLRSVPVMKVILKENIENLGHLGDVKDVAPGYARNFLIPRGLVIAATAHNLAEVEHERGLIEARIEKLQGSARELAGKIDKAAVTISVKVGEDGKMFGSVTAKHIIDALAEQGIEVDRHAIQLSSPVKSVGDVKVPVKLVRGVTAELAVSVVSDSPEAKPAKVKPAEPEPAESESAEEDS